MVQASFFGYGSVQTPASPRAGFIAPTTDLLTPVGWELFHA
jgi:hypothetical protein